METERLRPKRLPRHSLRWASWSLRAAGCRPSTISKTPYGRTRACSASWAKSARHRRFATQPGATSARPRAPLALGKGVKVFVPWSLCGVVGEWNFYPAGNDPTNLIDEHWYMTDYHVSRDTYYQRPTYPLEGSKCYAGGLCARRSGGLDPRGPELLSRQEAIRHHIPQRDDETLLLSGSKKEPPRECQAGTVHDRRRGAQEPADLHVEFAHRSVLQDRARAHGWRADGEDEGQRLQSNDWRFRKPVLQREGHGRPEQA